jgi:hypothetical protein
MSVRSQHTADNEAHFGVKVPQGLWEDIISFIESQMMAERGVSVDLMRRIRQHFDGPDTTE